MVVKVYEICIKLITSKSLTIWIELKKINFVEIPNYGSTIKLKYTL